MNRGWSTFFSLAIALVTLWVLASAGKLGPAIALWRTVPGPVLLCALGLYVATYPLRAYRWLLLMRGRGIVANLVPYTWIVGIHTAGSNFLPFKSGELLFPMLVRRRGIPFSEGFVFLLAGRMLDAGSMLILALPLFLGKIGIVAAAAVCILGVAVKGPLCVLLLRLANRPGKIAMLRPPLERIASISVPAFVWLGTVTMAVWILKLLAVATITRAVVSGELFRILAASLGAELAFLVPLSGWMGLGNYEAGWLLSSWLGGGRPGPEAALFAHTFLLVASAFVGAASAFFFCLRGRERFPEKVDKAETDHGDSEA
ncbi:MAG: flippase-like domain-containing protein [Synergistales bacterium]|nr:flippase-like domain-containing protein [Synergistales bacterium]